MKPIKLLSGFFAILLATSTVCAQNQTFDFNLTVGTLFPGKVQASYHSYFPDDETFDFNIKQTFVLKMGADYNMLKYLSIGLNLNYVPINISDDDFRYLGVVQISVISPHRFR